MIQVFFVIVYNDLIIILCLIPSSQPNIVNKNSGSSHFNFVSAGEKKHENLKHPAKSVVNPICI